MILDRELIQKYKLAKQGNQIDGVMLLPSCNGEYVKYSDHVKEIEKLFTTICNKEFEITAISDRLNNMYLTTKDTIS